MKEPRQTRRSRSADEASPLTSDLAARIRRARAEEPAAGDAEMAAATRNMSGWNRGIRLGSEFIAAILVGAGMGYLLDLWLKTGPWLMLVMVMVGFVAGVLNVVRSASEMNRAAPPPTDAMRAPDDEEDE